MSTMQPKKQTKTSRKKLRRVLLTTTLLLGTQGLYGLGAQAVIAPAGQVIQNKATGSFVDAADNTEQAIQSNVVQVTVAEVAGIRIDPLGITGTPSLGATIYFDFTVTNIGNDPTQFFIPSIPSSITGGTAGTIQLIAYDPDGSGPTAPTTLAVNVNSSAPTGGLTGSATFNNGSIPAGGTITVRVPVTVTATGNNPVSVRLGNTPAAPNDQNQSFIPSGNDLYTIDNTGTTNGDLVSGPPINGTREASATLSTNAIPNITGIVFEDVNYGGGAGRPFGTAGTVGRSGATVELYKSDGTFVATTTTIAGGQYTFTNVTANADYIVRVVNSKVSSSRPGGTTTGLLPVQTFRTDAATGTALPITDHVGGEKPTEEDAPARSGSQTLADLSALTNQEVQSVTTVKVGSTDVTDVDFGYNFDTIINTNDSGQGSLRQFITNSNALTNTGLAQVGQTAGKEVSIFMISDGLTHNGLRAGLTNLLSPQGVAIIRNTTMLPIITDTNTSIDGNTQTTNVGNTNTLSLSYSGKIGTGLDGVLNTADDAVFSSIAAPEIEIIGTQAATSALEINGNSFLLQGVSVHGAGFQGTVNQINGCVRFNGTNDFTVNNSFVGISATSLTKPSSTETCQSHGIGSTVGVSKMNLTNNLVAYNGVSGIITNAPGPYTNLTVTGNESAFNGWNQPDQGDGLAIASATGSTITGNYLHDNQAYGLQDYITSGQTIANNTIANNGLGGTETSGIMEWGTVSNTIAYNIINNNAGDGIAVARHPSISAQALSNKITISKNSIFENAHLSINLAQPSVNTAVDYRTGGLPYVTPNNGTTGSTFANNGMDYPIITSSTLSGGTLTIKGFVGSNAAGSSSFANATLEFFVADDDGNNKGEVILGDGKQLPHGEGKTYLPPNGLCKTDASSKFTCTFSNLPPQFTTTKNITATATDTNGNTSEFSATAINNPNVLLVKRITAIKRKGTSTFVSNTTYTDDPNYAYDDNDLTIPAPATPTDPPEDTDKWPDPTLYLQGLIDGGAVNPGDEVEFTIYFLSTGVTPAKNMALCDVLPKNMTFAADSFNGSLPTDTSSLPGENLGIAVANDATTLPSAPTIYLTNIGGDDQAQFIPAGSVPPSVCKDPSNSSIGLTAATNTTGAIYLQLRNDLPPATAQGDPKNSYGFVRFRAKVN